MRRLKADFHTHAADDTKDRLNYSAEMLIEAAAQLKFDILAITCHEQVVSTLRLERYAAARGILLIPAVELLVEGKHVVMLNPDAEQAGATTFAQLRKLGKRKAVLLAPHPFYPAKACLHRALLDNIDLFDAIEYCSVYFRGINPNRRGVKLARQRGLPLLGTSDTHVLPYKPLTFSWVEAEELSVEAVIDAIRAGHVRLETRPLPYGRVPHITWLLLREHVQAIADKLNFGG